MASGSRGELLKGMGGMAALAFATACSRPAPTPARGAPARAGGAAPTSAPSAAQTAPAAVAATGSTVNITYWGAFGGHNSDVQTQIVDRFNQSQKAVVVTLQNQNTYQDLAAKLTAALQAKNAPEGGLLSDGWWFKVYLNKTLQPLDHLMETEQVT